MTDALDKHLIFIKLGGSIITDKSQAETVDQPLLDDLTRQIAVLRKRDPQLKIILGHGSGSFGHMAAARYGTEAGVRTSDEWKGFQEVWMSARRLNQCVITTANDAGLPVVAFAPSASVIAADKQVLSWDLAPMRQALELGMVPVTYGDVVFDQVLGGTILSTEKLFSHLAKAFKPSRILLAGHEKGVYADYPANQTLLPRIDASSGLSGAIQGSAQTDVTGGMFTKVRTMLDLCAQLPGLEVTIFSGREPDALLRVLDGELPSTSIN